MRRALWHIINEAFCAIEYAIQTVDIPSLAECCRRDSHISGEFNAFLTRQEIWHACEDFATRHDLRNH